MLISKCYWQLEYKALEEKLQSVRDESKRLNDKCSELQRTLDSERVAWANDKKTLEDTIVDMSTSEKHSEDDRSLREAESRRQEERATVRQINELRKHSDDILSSGCRRKILPRGIGPRRVDQDD